MTSNRNFLLINAIAMIFGFVANAQEANTKVWNFEDLLGFFEPGTSQTTIPIIGELSSGFETRQCHHLTGCTKWILTENVSPGLVYKKSIQVGRVVKEVTSIFSDSDVIFPVNFLQLKPALQFTDLGRLELIIESGERRTLQNWDKYNTPYFKFVSEFDQASQSFKKGYLDGPPFSYVLETVVNCAPVGFEQMCETGYYYNQGRFIFSTDKAVKERIEFETADSIAIINDTLVISFNKKSQVSGNGVWIEAQWTIKAVIKRVINE